MSIRERENMIQFLVAYFGGDLNQLEQMNDRTLENTYQFAYERIEMENHI